MLPLAYGTMTSLKATVCGEDVEVEASDPRIDVWFETFLSIPCRLHRSAGARHGHFERADRPVPILLSNESPFLLISSESVDWVNDWIAAEQSD